MFPKIASLLKKKSQLLLKNANEARCLPVPSTANIIHTYRLVGILEMARSLRLVKIAIKMAEIILDAGKLIIGQVMCFPYPV